MAQRLEQSILGCALNSESTAQLIAQKLKPDDFFDMRHGRIFEAIRNAVLHDEPTDAVSISSSANVDTMLLVDLIQAGGVPAQMEYHIHLLKENAARRRLSQAGSRIQQLSEVDDFDKALSEAQAMLDSVVDVESAEAQKIGATIDETVEKFVQVQEGTAPDGLKTGFYDLDNLTTGLYPGQMIIVAARPGVGKSTIAVDIMRHLSIHKGIPTAIFSLEMSTHEINTRVLASEAQVMIQNMRKGTLSQGDWDKVFAAREKLEHAPLFIDESPENTVLEIVAKTKMLVKRHGVKLIVVDYLQLLRSGRREESRQQEVAGFSRALKLLAKSTGIPVIAVAQLNRESERNDSKPKPSDLRESGALEQDADLILLLHRDDVRGKDTERAGEVDVIVAKNRGGETGTVTLANQLYKGCFKNMAH